MTTIEGNTILNRRIFFYSKFIATMSEIKFLNNQKVFLVEINFDSVTNLELWNGHKIILIFFWLIKNKF